MYVNKNCNRSVRSELPKRTKAMVNIITAKQNEYVGYVWSVNDTYIVVELLNGRKVKFYRNEVTVEYI